MLLKTKFFENLTSCPILRNIKAKKFNKTKAHNVNYSALVFAVKVVEVLPFLTVLVDGEAMWRFHRHVSNPAATISYNCESVRNNNALIHVSEEGQLE